MTAIVIGWFFAVQKENTRLANNPRALGFAPLQIGSYNPSTNISLIEFHPNFNLRSSGANLGIQVDPPCLGAGGQRGLNSVCLSQGKKVDM